MGTVPTPQLSRRARAQMVAQSGPACPRAGSRRDALCRRSSIHNPKSKIQNRAAFALTVLACLSASGCADRRTLVDAFPTGAAASPWLLDSPVWSGDFESAAGAIGDDAPTWRRFAPQRVWLAVYKHESRPTERITVRVFDLGTCAQAQLAYNEFKPPLVPAFKAGDAACWTSDGLLLRWGRLVLDIFGGDAQRAAVPEQAVYLLAFLEKHMPPGMPENPR
jgi:hypothetical protein